MATPIDPHAPDSAAVPSDQASVTANSAGEGSNVRRVPGWLVLLLLGAVVLGSRLPSPWRAEVIGDEMLHLESWRNQYRSNDPMPIFRKRLEANQKIPAAWKPTLLNLYWNNPFFRRIPFVVGDPPSPLYSVVAEVNEAVTQSSLMTLRGISVFFGIAAIVMVYFVGCAIADRTLGLWLATLLAIGPLNQVYSGIGRPHSLNLFAQFCVLYAFARETRGRYETPWRFLLTALIAQTTHWASWALFGPIVFSVLIRRWLVEGESIPRLFRETWWYALGSFGLLGIFALESMTASVYEANVGYRGLATLWDYVCIASPFAHLAVLGQGAYWFGGVVFVGLIGLGIVATFEPGSDLRPFRWPFLVSLCLVMSAAFVMCSGTRHMVVYYPMPLLLGGIGVRRLLVPQRAAQWAMAAVLALAFVPSVIAPEDPYQRVLTNDPRYSEVGDGLAAALEPGERWISFPHFMGHPLYRQHRFPEPLQPLNMDELAQTLRERPVGTTCVALVPEHVSMSLPELQGATFKKSFGPGWTIVKLPPLTARP